MVAGYRFAHAKAEVASALPKDPGVELGTEPPNCLLLQCPPRIHKPLPLGRLQSVSGAYRSCSRVAES